MTRLWRIDQWSLRTRLLVAFLGVLIPYLVLAGVGVVGFWGLWQSVESIRHEAVAEIESTANLRLAVTQLVLPANHYLITGDPREREEFDRRLARVKQFIDLVASAFHDPEEHRLLEIVKGQVVRIEGVSRQLLALSDPRTNPAALAEMTALVQLADDTVEVLERITAIADREIEEEIERGSHRSRQVILAGIVALLLSIAGAAALAVFFSAWLSRPTVALAETSRRIAEGDLSQRVEVHTGGELGEATRAFNQMADALEHAEKEKADFTAMLIHDLRAPLMAVLSGAAILEDGLEGPVNEAQKKWLARIEAGVRKVVDLVNDFLDLSKIEAGRIALEKKEIDLGQLIHESIENYHALAQKKQITLKSRIDATFPQVKADPRYLDQVFSNLLSNAIKFTPEGGAIELGTARESKGEVKVWVKDTGAGIAPHEMENLFEKYRQTASGKNSSHKGTGLGLVISKMIVEAHGGKIWVESPERQGATFFFTLPLNA